MRACRAKRRNFKSTTLAAKRIKKLRSEPFGEGRGGDTVMVWQRVCRHVISAEHQIENRERGGEVLRSAPLGSGMVPAMEDRTGDDVPEQAQRPVEIGVHECRMRDGDRTQYH